MTIRLAKWQTKVWDDAHRYIVVNCGRRAGKTFLVALKLIDFASKHAKTTTWYVAPDYKQAKQIMWLVLKDLLPTHAIEKTNDTELLIILTNGSKILLKGAQDPDTLRGVRIDFCVFDECAFMANWEEVWKVIRPTLVDSKAAVWFISTPNGFNHFKTLAETQDPDWSYHHYTSYDNPYLDPAELDKARAEMDDDSFAQEFMGEFRKLSGLIYREFNRDLHMVDVPNLGGYTFFRSLDFGFGHKTALGYFAVSPTSDAIYLYDGLYQTNLVTKDIAESVKVKDASKFITGAWADSARPDLIEELKHLGVLFEPVNKAPDSVLQGITDVAALLKVRNDTGKPTLMVAKHLTWVADEFERYRWVQSKNENSSEREAPLKRDDDAMDMIRYFARMYKGDRPVLHAYKPKEMLRRKYS